MASLIHDPLTRFLAQVLVVVMVSRALGVLLRGVGQPAVVGEIIAGIFLGPSLLGWVAPGVFGSLFTPDSVRVLQVLSHFGLVLYMFLVGLEFDTSLLRGRARASVAISHMSIVVPFALGALLALQLHGTYAPRGIPLTSFVLFTGAAMSITAFPVLVRILTEQRLMGTRLGTLAIACAAVDDVTAWCLLAYVVAVTRAAALVPAVVTTALALSYMVVMAFAVRPLLSRAMKAHSAVTHGLFAAVLLLLLLSSWATELIGIHALFGAFVFGAILPKPLAGALSEKLEAPVVVILLPLFFSYSGIRTHIGSLSSVSAWMTCGLIVFAACAGKFGGSAIAARFAGLSWRESAAIGVLMNTRGLMELIVLNIGLDLGVIDQRLFTMMVLMAITTTVATTPLLKIFGAGDASSTSAVDSDASRALWSRTTEVRP